MSATDWSELAVSGLPTGTVTLLLADVEGSTRLWETQPGEMSSAIARLDTTLAELIAIHGGVRPVEQGEGDSFVLAFARASDAVACALAVQRAPLAPIRLRIGVNTGEIQLRDESNYIGPTINRTARLRDLAHGGQTVLSGATESMVIDHLPADAWLTDLGTHALRDLPRPERVVQLCHPDLNNEFPPLRIKTATAQRLPTHLTSFIGREAEIAEARQALSNNRLVTLTGAGGAGKTRLAIKVAARVAREFDDGEWYADLAPITDPAMVPVAVGRAFGLPDQPSQSEIDPLVRFVGDQQVLVVLDNCEHLLDASATLVVTLLSACPNATVLATSREPIGVAGEVSLRVPSLALNDEAIELFGDRARLTRPQFSVTDENQAVVREICHRLDGMPLAIELAAARVRALSLSEILDSLHDRFRLLTGGSRTAVRRQQTLHASVDWSHALLTEPERVLFRRLAAFVGGFDLESARAVAGSGEVERYQVLDQLALLVDKSLVVAEEGQFETRYRLLETVRQYALEKLGESGEADTIRTRHRDHYLNMAAVLDRPVLPDRRVRIDQADNEIDNLRAAFSWCYDNSDPESALRLASALQPLWLTRGRLREGLDWFATVLDHCDITTVSPAVRAAAMADKAVLDGLTGVTEDASQADEALAIARELGDPALLVRALTGRVWIAGRDGKTASPFIAESVALARTIGDSWRLSQILARQSWTAIMADGDPALARASAEEGLQLADALGDGYHARMCRFCIGMSQWMTGDSASAVAAFERVVSDASAEHDAIWRQLGLDCQSYVLAWTGHPAAARSLAEVGAESAAELGEIFEGVNHAAFALAALADGDVDAARQASERAWRCMGVQRETVTLTGLCMSAFAGGDLCAAKEMADEAVSTMAGWHRQAALTTRSRIAHAQGQPEQAEADAHEALALGESLRAYQGMADTLECLAALAGDAGRHREAARLSGAAAAIRQRTGDVRFKIFDAQYESSVGLVRDEMGQEEFDAAWAEGAALSTEEAIAYAQRGRGERKRPSTGWGSLTPTELDVVRLVSEGLGNKDIAARLFISHRTVQTHLTHVYAKMGLTSRVQLAQEAARHG